jgi:hypothetical protein
VTPTYAVEDGRYSYTHITGEVFDTGPEMAMVFDVDDDPRSTLRVTVLKHGPVDKVTHWYETVKDAYKTGGFPEWAEGFVLVTGKLDVDEVDKAIAITGYRPSFLSGGAR